MTVCNHFWVSDKDLGADECWRCGATGMHDDKTMTDCKTRFDNKQEFNGTPTVPVSGPITLRAGPGASEFQVLDSKGRDLTDVLGVTYAEIEVLPSEKPSIVLTCEAIVEMVGFPTVRDAYTTFLQDRLLEERKGRAAERSRWQTACAIFAVLGYVAFWVIN